MTTAELSTDRTDIAHTDTDELVAPWTFGAFLLATIDLVAEHGAAHGLDLLRERCRTRGIPCGRRGWTTQHETLLVFYVWAVQRLLEMGVPRETVVWQPLLGSTAPLAWYEPETLWSTDARQRFVPSDRALPGEPAPHYPVA